eukprot:scaffold159229_cov13-Tisochrysis_lutea.AAC.1
MSHTSGGHAALEGGGAQGTLLVLESLCWLFKYVAACCTAICCIQKNMSGGGMKGKGRPKPVGMARGTPTAGALELCEGCSAAGTPTCG